MEPNAAAILVVEDNDVNRTLIVRQLEKLGYTVKAVVNGSEAVDAVRKTHYRVVLMDLFMPGMNGFEAARRIREIESIRWGRTAIIAVTADATEWAKVASSVAGMDDYISKPVMLETLKSVLERWLPPNQVEEAESVTVGPGADGPTARLDPGALERMTEQLGDPDAVREMIAGYLAELPARVRSIRTAAFGRDAQSLNLAAHTLRSRSILFGATALAALCRELEASAQTGNTEDIEEKILPLEMESRAVEVALRRRLSSGAAT